ncbi:hypothetical protein SAMN05442782_1414 [Streptomyces sp. OK228]|nr:hypothetical protein SAMN05442782_1414 [Streptomyces sp. OK228]
MVETRERAQDRDDKRSDSPRSGASDRGESPRDDSRGAKGGGRDTPERWTDDHGNEHERSRTPDGQTKESVSSNNPKENDYSKTTTWKDGNGDTTRIANEHLYKGQDGKWHEDRTDSKGSYDEKTTKWRSEDNHTHSDSTVKNENGTTHTTTDSYKDSKGDTHTHHTSSHTDLAGNTRTKDWDTTEKADKKPSQGGGSGSHPSPHSGSGKPGSDSSKDHKGSDHH